MTLLTLALADCPLAAPDEPARLDLLTLSPGDALFSSMGHSALVFSGDGGAPVSFDWGATAPDADPLTFLRGRLPFFLRLQPLSLATERTVVLQQIPATAHEVRALRAELTTQVGQSFTYHWGEANCATHARDALEPWIPRDDSPAPTTARWEARRHLAPWPILGWSWDFLVGAPLDRPLTHWQRAMMPEALMNTVRGPRCVIAGTPFAPATPPARALWALPGLAGGLLVLRTPHRWAGPLMMLYGAVLGLLGTASLLLSLSSSLDGIGPTAGWLLAGPQSWLWVWWGWQMRSGRKTPRTHTWAMAALGCSAVPAAWILGQDLGGPVLTLLPGVLACAWSLQLAAEP